jgi:hypothetical protein
MMMLGPTTIQLLDLSLNIYIYIYICSLLRGHGLRMYATT